MKVDPFEVSPESKISLLLQADEVIRRNQEGEDLRGLHGALSDRKKLCLDGGILHQTGDRGMWSGDFGDSDRRGGRSGTILPQLLQRKFRHSGL